jgi:hypothetical protein
VADNLINQGLERFAMGDLAGATRVWLAARAIFPDDPQLKAYLDHVQQVSPQLFAHIEAEAQGQSESADAPRPSASRPPPPGAPQRLEGVPLSVGSPLVVATAPRPAPSTSLTPPPHTPLPGSIQALASPDDVWGRAEGRVEIHSTGLGLSLVGPPVAARESSSVQQPREQELPLPILLEKLREAMSLDNFTGALELADRILAVEPENVEAQHAIKRSHGRLSTIYGSKLGPLDAIPQVRIPPGEVIWLDLDHRAGFVLAQVDGQSSYEEILDLTGMERLEALRILVNLVQKKIIAPRGA